MTFMMTDRTEARTFRGDATIDLLRYSCCECALGEVLVARSAAGVCAVLIGDNSDELEAELASRFPDSILLADGVALGHDLREVVRFMNNPTQGLDLTLDVRGTPFQRRVWETLREVPSGETVSYSELARRMSPLSSPRAVANACAANKIAMAIPCHRVVRNDGTLSGYRWGVERKRALLNGEREAK